MSIPRMSITSTRTALFITLILATASVVMPDYFSAGAGQPANAGLLNASKPGMPALPEPGPFGQALPAKGKFLVASRNLLDPRFRETVVLLIDYSAQGAAGLIINRPSKAHLAELL